MSEAAATEDGAARTAECWCCGATDEPSLMIRLGNHPEVALCVGCGRWAAKQATAIEDRGRTGAAVRAREGMRAARQVVIEHGWHRNRVFGGLLRQLGRYLP